ncbi:protein FAM83D [Chanos chanos]|uniref:Protein FAM83D n=1 Tax=Chanos chanos TaxID=29144 RepID=A0A6J2VSH8_CHACN|nr:protein FAM83D-like [Chanos chanos]
MALSQCLEDSPGWRTPSVAQDLNFKDLYNERHRLALEELVAGGIGSFMEFLKKEKIPNFLSEDEIKRISRSTIVPRSISLIGEDALLDHSVSGTVDCSSVTYFPEISDIEPPILEMGWPAFTTGSFRGVTRAVAYFQPSYGECIYSCKEAARRMIKSAKEVIAIVTDSLTDLDIFRDLQEACTLRRVPVYVLLDQSSVSSFLQMCTNINVRLDDLRLMRVRTITGSTYFLRSGARITGKVHERFMLIDGNRVATGSYRFNWTDGKLNSSNLIELSGQITENFDEEFRILYAQSLPLNMRAPSSARNSGIYDHLLLKPPATPPPQPSQLVVPEPVLPVCMTSTPARPKAPEDQQPSKETEDKDHESNPVSDTSTFGDDWMEQKHRNEVLTSDVPPCLLKEVTDHATNTSAVDMMVPSPRPSCHISTQTSYSTVERAVQTERDTFLKPTKPANRVSLRPPIRCGPAPPDSSLRECFRKLTKERQYHYSTIRSKLDHMVSLLSQRRELVDLTNLALGSSPHRGRKAHQQEGRHVSGLVDNALMGTWPRSRCLH